MSDISNFHEGITDPVELLRHQIGKAEAFVAIAALEYQFSDFHNEAARLAHEKGSEELAKLTMRLNDYYAREDSLVDVPEEPEI